MLRSGSVAVVATLLVASACGSSSNTETGAKAPATATAAHETRTVPSGWVTYNDETAGFEISYPDSWVELEPGLHRDALESMFEGSVDFAATTGVFGAGLERPEGGGFNPNVAVTVEPVASDLTLDEYDAAATRAIEQLFDNWETTSKSKIQLGDREALMSRSSVPLSEFDPSVADESRVWLVQLSALSESLSWEVSCSTVALTESAAQDSTSTCEEVLRTFVLYAP